MRDDEDDYLEEQASILASEQNTPLRPRDTPFRRPSLRQNVFQGTRGSLLQTPLQNRHPGTPQPQGTSSNHGDATAIYEAIQEIMISQREAAEAAAKAAQRQRELELAIIKEREQSEERTRARELAHAKELKRIMASSWSGPGLRSAPSYHSHN